MKRTPVTRGSRPYPPEPPVNCIPGARVGSGPVAPRGTGNTLRSAAAMKFGPRLPAAAPAPAALPVTAPAVIPPAPPADAPAAAATLLKTFPAALIAGPAPIDAPIAMPSSTPVDSGSRISGQKIIRPRASAPGVKKLGLSPSKQPCYVHPSLRALGSASFMRRKCLPLCTIDVIRQHKFEPEPTVC
jgi:hypothetical protein